ncbi:MAG: hypothetical protein WD669_03145 [Pirellulales bacterium]
MIPPFDELGNLPPGIHPATPDEIDVRFGQVSELRRVQMESVRWMIDLARRASVKRVVLNGSFVTDIMDPNDVDCVLLPGDEMIDVAAEDALVQGLPFLDIKLVASQEFNEFVNVTFASDRFRASKGMIEVASWT